VEHNITADIYASWSDSYPSYRVYVDGDLLTERDFIWKGHEIFIREHIVVNLSPGHHNLLVEQITSHGSIRVQNILVDGVPSTADFNTFE